MSADRSLGDCALTVSMDGSQRGLLFVRPSDSTYTAQSSSPAVQRVFDTFGDHTATETPAEQPRPDDEDGQQTLIEERETAAPVGTALERMARQLRSRGYEAAVVRQMGDQWAEDPEDSIRGRGAAVETFDAAPDADAPDGLVTGA